MGVLSPVLCGVAGEYFVAAELSRLGYIASITLRNTRGVDILASDANASRQVGIQVKSNQGNARAWILNEKAERYIAKNLFYVFVNLRAHPERPEFFVVPSKDVAAHITTGHSDWLTKKGPGGRPHKDSS